ncbi:hypothetical protein ACFVUS_31340 [Nocardia sp. NPDC058058]|uniref:hypothetical protein n=1 Tax=Nocardia sp. NPDC058058 TaxID=3346317 RepID=UPI0036DACEE1
MSSPVGRDRWLDLLERFAEQKRRLREAGDLEEDSHPNTGATQAQLVAAEQRLGRPLDPQHRELLSVADGWGYFNLFYSLLGTAEIGVGARWASGVESARIWFETEEWDEEIGARTDAEDYHQLVTSDNGYFSTAFVFVGESASLPTGSVVQLPPEDNDTYPDLYSYLTAKVDEIAKYA